MMIVNCVIQLLFLSQIIGISNGKFISLFQNLTNVLNRQTIASTSQNFNYFTYDSSQLGDLANKNFSLGMWLLVDNIKSTDQQFILSFGNINLFSLVPNKKEFYENNYKWQDPDFNFNYWFHLSFLQTTNSSGKFQEFAIQNVSLTYYTLTLTTLISNYTFSLFQTKQYGMVSWRGKAIGVSLITDVNTLSLEYISSVVRNYIVPLTMLFLKFQEKKQTKLIKDWSDYQYEIIVGDSYFIQTDIDDPSLDLTDQSYIFKSNQFLKVKQFYFPQSFTIEMKFSIIQSTSLAQFNLLVLEQTGINVLYIYYQSQQLYIYTLTQTLLYPINMTTQPVHIILSFLDHFNSTWINYYQYDKIGQLLKYYYFEFYSSDFSTKYNQILYVGHKSNQFLNGEYIKFYQLKIDQGFYFAEFDYIPNCALYNTDRCVICQQNYIVADDGTCVSNCPNGYIIDALRNQCIRQCHQLCATCDSNYPTVCLTCSSSNRQNPPDCTCIQGLDDGVSPDCLNSIPDSSIQTGIVEGNTNTFTQTVKFTKNYNQIPTVLLSLIGFIENVETSEFQSFVKDPTPNQFTIQIISSGNTAVYYKIQWMAGIGNNFISSKQDMYQNTMVFNQFQYPLNSSNNQVTNYLGWLKAQTSSTSNPYQFYLSSYINDEMGLELIGYCSTPLSLYKYQYFEFQNLYVANLSDDMYTNQNLGYGIQAAELHYFTEFIPLSVDFIYLQQQIYFQESSINIINTSINYESHFQNRSATDFYLSIQNRGDHMMNFSGQMLFGVIQVQQSNNYFDYVQSLCNLTLYNCDCNQPGYYWSQLNIQCLPCNQNCYTCTDPNDICITCIPIQNKILSNTSKCICDDGYYEDINNICQLCNFPCFTCNIQPTNCTSCDKSLFRIQDQGNPTTCICMDKYFQNSTNICQDCLSSCATCDNVLTCLDCPAERTLSDIHLCDCNSGTYDLSGQCVACPQLCATCSSDSLCNSCVSQSIPSGTLCSCDSSYFQSANECLPCDSNCKECLIQPTQCTGCFNNHTIINNICTCYSNQYLSTIDNFCIDCDPSCLTCDFQSKHCLTCNLDRLFDASNNSCLCIPGTYQVDSQCQDCDPMCLECQDTSTTCTKCPVDLNQVIINGKCICLANQFSDEQGICQNCDESCSQCVQLQTNCTECHYGKYLIQGSCLDCHFTCLTCNGSKEFECLTCGQNKYLTYENKCLCLEGYYDIYQWNCEKCHFNCKNCTEYDHCNECKENSHRIIEDNTKKCVCEQHYYEDLESQECKQCSNQCSNCFDYDKCITCDETIRQLVETKCVCKSGYFMTSLNECQNCLTPEGKLEDSCQYIDCSDGVWTKGEQCDDGNDLGRDGCTNCQIDANYNCINELLKVSFCYICPKNCSKCLYKNSLINCDLCSDGYFITDGVCKECNNDCSTCSSLNFCLSCKIQGKIPNEQGRCQKCEDIKGMYTSKSGDSCFSKCGDSIVYEQIEQCDDGNLMNGDGCDQNCQLEKYFQCQDGVCQALPQPVVAAQFVNSTTKNNVLIQMPLNNNCSSISVTIEQFKESDFNATFRFNSNSTTDTSCIIDFEFLKTIDTTNIIHIKIPLSSNRRLLDSDTALEVREVTITPRKQIYYSETQQAQAQSAQNAQDTFGQSLYFLGPATILLGGFQFFWTILDILSWLNNLYYFNIYFPQNVSLVFQQAAWGDISLFPTIIEFNSPDDPYYTETPPKFMEKEVDPFFLNNTWMSFSIICATFLFYLFSIIFVKTINKLFSFNQVRNKKQKNFQNFQNCIFNVGDPIRYIEDRYKTNVNQQKQPTEKIIDFKKRLPYIVRIPYEKAYEFKISFGGQVLKSLNLAFLDLILAGTLQILYVGVDNLGYLDVLINSIVCYSSIMLCILVIYFQYKMTQHHHHLLNYSRYEKVYGTLYEGINTNSRLAMSYQFFNLIRKALYIIFVIIFYYNPLFQTLTCCLISFINIALISYENPFKNRLDLIQCGIPDLCIFVLTFICTGIALDDKIAYLTADARFNIGWLMLAFIGLSILTQLLFLIRQFILDMIERYKYIIAKCRNFSKKS